MNADGVKSLGRVSAWELSHQQGTSGPSQPYCPNALCCTYRATFCRLPGSQLLITNMHNNKCSFELASKSAASAAFLIARSGLRVLAGEAALAANSLENSRTSSGHAGILSIVADYPTVKGANQRKSSDSLHLSAIVSTHITRTRYSETFASVALSLFFRKVRVRASLTADSEILQWMSTQSGSSALQALCWLPIVSAAVACS